jgi:hypothetical protein
MTSPLETVQVRGTNAPYTESEQVRTSPRTSTSAGDKSRSSRGEVGVWRACLQAGSQLHSTMTGHLLGAVGLWRRFSVSLHYVIRFRPPTWKIQTKVQHIDFVVTVLPWRLMWCCPTPSGSAEKFNGSLVFRRFAG